jgi:hypothetical protein
MNGKYCPKAFLFLALAMLSFASLAQMKAEDLTPESFRASAIKIKDGIPIESQFPRLNLVRIRKKIPVLDKSNCCKPDAGYCYRNTGCLPDAHWWGKEGFLIPGDKEKKTAIRKSPYMEEHSYWYPNPDATRWLGSYGGSKYAVVSADTGIATILPYIIGENIGGSTFWWWRTNDTLIGMTREYLLKPSKHPYVTDPVPYLKKVFFFLYDLNDAGNKPYMLNLPKIKRGRIIQLKGVTPKGGLVLVEVIPREADRDGDEVRMLGVFDIAPPKGKSK